MNYHNSAEGMSSDQGYRGGYPNTAYNEGYPNTAYNGGYPNTAYHGGYPNTGYPNTGYPNAGYPNAGYAQSDYQQGGYQGHVGFSSPPYYNNEDEYNKYNQKNADYYNDPYGSHSGTYLSADLDRAIRHAFLRKVFVILTIALTVTFAFAGCVNLIDSFGQVIIDNYLVFLIVGIILYIVPSLALVCSDSLAQKVPINYILLVLMIVGSSFLIGSLAALSSPFAFFTALGCTVAVSVGLIIFASQVKYDFTGWGPYLMIAFLIFMIIAFVAIFVRQPIFHTILAGFGALLMSFAIVMDTQYEHQWMIVGGKHRKYQLSIDQYITAVVILYIDIVALFMYLLQILNITTSD